MRSESEGKSEDKSEDCINPETGSMSYMFRPLTSTWLAGRNTYFRDGFYELKMATLSRKYCVFWRPRGSSGPYLKMGPEHNSPEGAAQWAVRLLALRGGQTKIKDAPCRR